MTETDREYLELAAKAAGYWICEPLRYGEFRVCNPEQNHLSFAWNPITDDGDALRLAVKLGIQITHHIPFRKHIPPSVSAYYRERFEEPYGNDHLAATRLAVVRAAAEIGRSMK